MKNKLIIGAFILMLAGFAVMLALPADRESVENENREMSEMPQLSQENVFSGKFASDAESFIGDNIGFRSYLRDWARAYEGIKGITPHTGSVISTNKDIGTGTTIKMTLLFAGDTIMEMFLKHPETEKLYTDAVNSYAEKLPDNIRLYNMIIPTQLEFREPIYKNLQDSQSAAINDMYNMLDERVTAVDVCDTLAGHSDEYIYFRSDHHWTQLGAYYAYCEFMKTEGGAAVNKEDYEKNEINGVLGYLYDRVSTPGVEKKPDTIEWYDIDPKERISVRMLKAGADGSLVEYEGVMYDEQKKNYNFFFGSDHPVVEMENADNPDGKTIVVIKDSYANVFAPWLAKSYKRVVLVDPRIYSGTFQKVLDSYNPDEVLITNYIFTTNFPDYCSMMKNLYK